MQWKPIASHVVAGIMSVVFLGEGLAKMIGTPGLAEHFEHWGLPLWFMGVVGVFEVVAAILIAIPKTRFFGAVMICALMVGATGTHERHEEALSALLTVAIGLIAGGFAWFSWPPALVADAAVPGQH